MTKSERFGRALRWFRETRPYRKLKEVGCDFALNPGAWQPRDRERLLLHKSGEVIAWVWLDENNMVKVKPNGGYSELMKQLTERGGSGHIIERAFEIHISDCDNSLFSNMT